MLINCLNFRYFDTVTSAMITDSILFSNDSLQTMPVLKS